ncbi:glycoside hydrolase family 18 protein [Frateuria sp. Soil773]|uniref:glycoside hydrolase family 18 protein n=1 Tax=Frateuria sp. Soil773 TaxID=1736407 RepID=UPI000ABCC5F6|nr:glycoside hydrolase family 18 protein [Frateuria sp. Soil773]
MRGSRLPFLLQAAVLLAAGLLAACTANTRPAPADYRVIGYATGWNAAQDGQVRQIDTLIFAFARLVDGRVVLDEAGAGKLRRLIALKAVNPRLKVAISVGGWGVGGFSEAAGSAEGRRRFADSAAELVAAQGADGFDVDWEYPGHGESGIRSSPQDRANFTLLLQAVRASLDRVGALHARSGAGRYTLSIAAADGPFASGIDIAAVAPLLDWFNLMTYDFVNGMTPTTGHHTGLHPAASAPADARTVDRAVRQFLAAGAPARKLVIGAAFYGREFADVQPVGHGLYQRYGKYQGEHLWPQLKADFIGKQGYVRYWDADAQAPWLWNAQTRRFISYDDPQSLAAKAAYVRAQRLGGIMYWEQSQDPQGELLHAIRQGLPR